jgi:glycosyltransferase involved in cell wall biosynthesis
LFKHFFVKEAHVVYQPVDTLETFNPNIIDRNEALKRIPYKYRNARLVIIGVKEDAWFVPVIEKLVENFKDTQTVFMVIGAFPEAQAICEEKGLDAQVYFTGNVPYHILPEYIACSELSLVLTHPNLASVWYSPHNIAKIADYMSMGKPIITDTVAAQDYVKNGKTGFLVENIEMLLDKTITVLDDKVMMKKMGEAARRFACENFDTVKVAKNYLHLIKQVDG